MHPHIYFAHAFKGQDGAEEVLARFERGGGDLLDIEYLTVDGRRVVAFGRWAGYVGAALGVLTVRGQLETPLTPMTRPELDDLLAASLDDMSALVIGARGRSGGGAVEALAVAGARITPWDAGHTRDLDREALLEHDLLVNCVVSRGQTVDPWVRPEDLDVDRRLRVISDVTCDVTSSANLIPVNTSITTWNEPVRRIVDQPLLDVIAIDNLPSLLPREASESFSAELSVLIAETADLGSVRSWAEAQASYAQASYARHDSESPVGRVYGWGRQRFELVTATDDLDAEIAPTRGARRRAHVHDPRRRDPARPRRQSLHPDQQRLRWCTSHAVSASWGCVWMKRFRTLLMERNRFVPSRRS